MSKKIKFKVGDRVKLVSNDPKHGLGMHVKTGDIGIVSEAHDLGACVELHVDFHDRKRWAGMESEFVMARKESTATKKPTTPKTKETKSMTTKKPGTSHGKPTAKGMKEALKPKATVKPKYPAAREVVGILIPDYRNPKSKATKAELVDQVFDLWDTAIEARRELATTGTKLDRALVDLKEAKAKIKALEAGK